jgi:hypothetical protein
LYRQFDYKLHSTAIHQFSVVLQLAVPHCCSCHKLRSGATTTKNYVLTSYISHLEAMDQKFKIQDGARANQLMKAIAVAVSKLAQWFSAHMLRSLPMRTVIPADAHAAPRVSVPVIYKKKYKGSLTRQFTKKIVSFTWKKKQMHMTITIFFLLLICLHCFNVQQNDKTDISE